MAGSGARLLRSNIARIVLGREVRPPDRDVAWFQREVVPKLDAFSLNEIAKATGLSLATCSRIRAGTRVPHPRHWEAFVN